MSEADDRARGDEMERALARTMGWALPAGTVLLAIGVGIVFGVGPAILVLAAGALVAVIGLLWASLRTLGGDAPLAEGLVTAVAMREEVSFTGERKRRVLRALKDLEHEHSIGKIDDEDYAQISATYRDQAKAILREMDVEIEPLRAKAEALAQAHLAKRGLDEKKGTEEKIPPAREAEPEAAEPVAASTSARRSCPGCATSNEPDAMFCKKCRTRLARIECASCTTSNEPDATFCKKCGASLDASDGAEPEKGTSDAAG